MVLNECDVTYPIDESSDLARSPDILGTHFYRGGLLLRTELGAKKLMAAQHRCPNVFANIRCLTGVWTLMLSHHCWCVLPAAEVSRSVITGYASHTLDPSIFVFTKLLQYL